MSEVKRLLSIDGGGIRGVIAAEILIQIEEALRAHNPKWQCLADYFDFVCGTSTGAILAAGLAKGMSAHDLLKIYQEKGEAIFTPAEHSWQDVLQALLKEAEKTLPWWLPYRLVNSLTPISLLLSPLLPRKVKESLAEELLTKYPGRALEDELQRIFVDADSKPMTLDSPELKTNLMIVSKNVTWGGTRFFVNNVIRKKFSAVSQCLKSPLANTPLWQIVRASCAAPTFFPPYPFEDFKEDKGYPAEFVDGAISPYNNPSFQLFLEATEPAYGTGWERGEDKLLLVSIGTGFSFPEIKYAKAKAYSNINWAHYLIDVLLNDSNLQQNQLMQLIGHQRKLQGDGGQSKESKLLTYCRFTVSFTADRFQKLKLTGIDPDTVKPLDCVDQIENLSRIGKAVAKEQFAIQLFEGFLD
jgi:hypothetical protein